MEVLEGLKNLALKNFVLLLKKIKPKHAKKILWFIRINKYSSFEGNFIFRSSFVDCHIAQ